MISDINTWKELFGSKKIVIGCIHLLPLPGSPLYFGERGKILDTALNEMNILEKNGVDGIIVENFRDMPFYPDSVPAVTIAAISSLCTELRHRTQRPLGVNVLRNDAEAAISIAAAVGLDFIRVNIHVGTMLTDQGLIQNKAHETLRLRRQFENKSMIFADVHVKHAVPITPVDPDVETRDLCERGLADAVIVSGRRTGAPVEISKLKKIHAASTVPILVGSGCTQNNLSEYIDLVDGFIIGSEFKIDGHAGNLMDSNRVKSFMNHFRQTIRRQS